MQEILTDIFLFFIAPGFLMTAALGLLACWLDRKITARLQYRKGPPWYQPLADILKLLGKEQIVPAGANLPVFLGAPLLGLTAVTLVSLILWLPNFNQQSTFVGDLIVVIYLLMIPSLALIIGSSASRNPLAALGGSREMKLVLAYELPFIIAIFTAVMKCNTILLGGLINWQVNSGMVIGSWSGFLAFLVCTLVIQAKLGTVPFDLAEADQELAAGSLIEYSGPALAVFKLTRAMLYLVLPLLLMTVFLGGIGNWWQFLLKYFIILLVLILRKNVNPRLRIDQALRLFWGPVTAIALGAFVLALFGW